MDKYFNLFNKLQGIWSPTRWDTSYAGPSPFKCASCTLYLSGSHKHLSKNVLLITSDELGIEVF